MPEALLPVVPPQRGDTTILENETTGIATTIAGRLLGEAGRVTEIMTGRVIALQSMTVEAGVAAVAGLIITTTTSKKAEKS